MTISSEFLSNVHHVYDSTLTALQSTLSLSSTSYSILSVPRLGNSSLTQRQQLAAFSDATSGTTVGGLCAWRRLRRWMVFVAGETHSPLHTFYHIAGFLFVVLCDKCITAWGESIYLKKVHRTPYTTSDVQAFHVILFRFLRSLCSCRAGGHAILPLEMDGLGSGRRQQRHQYRRE